MKKLVIVFLFLGTIGLIAANSPKGNSPASTYSECVWTNDGNAIYPNDFTKGVLLQSNYATNGTPTMVLDITTVLNENWDAYGQSFIESRISPTTGNGYGYFFCDSYSTNGTWQTAMIGRSFYGNGIFYRTNWVDVFSVTEHGIVSANGFACDKLSEDSFVVTDSSKHLATHPKGWMGDISILTASGSATLHITNGLIMSVTEP